MVNRLLDWLRRQVNGHCSLCGLAYEHDLQINLCLPCINELPVILHPCPCCGLPLNSEGISACGACLRNPQPFSKLIAPFRYTYPIKGLVTSFKHRGDLTKGLLLAEILSNELKKTWNQTKTIDGIIPIPLHPAKIRQRGFNQSTELAKVIGRRLDIPVYLTALKRHRYTASQQGLGIRERQQNLKNAFSLNTTVKGQRLILIDDVVTTTATVRSASSLLLQSGALEVRIWAVARTI